ncbi:hypothetical protein [Litchfieldia salsa]|uniref:Uncharacterized protein n=1 Tax=Litchfieldia salsa TaxID=930152 RepID=A0A1H0X072_9BACI|nr:hypothetical protein [Litchfieldia salsa]SDP96270.1 hypothetical protein SAMN05216565_1219 [Litchfieldia salsa]
MLENNKRLTYSGEEIIEVLKEVEIILRSLHKQGSYYAEFIDDNGKLDKEKEREYFSETTHFIDDWKVTQRLAKIRMILSQKFDNTLGDDDMDDLERAMEGLKYWNKPKNRH